MVSRTERPEGEQRDTSKTAPVTEPETRVPSARAVRAGQTTRRGFLVTTATAGAGLLLGSASSAAETPDEPAAEAAAPAPNGAPAVVQNPGERLNICLIGLGAEGMVLMDAIQRIPGINIQAVCDIWDYSLRRGSGTLKKYGTPANAYTDYQDLLAAEKDLHAAVIATPDFVHAEHTIACLNAGLHVYCEKEMSNSLEQARQMVVAARETGKLLQIGHQRRSNPRYRHAIDNVILEAGLLGRVTQGYAQWNRAKSEDLGWPKRYEIDPDTLAKYGYESMHHFRNWRWYRKYGGGPIVDLGSHQIDIFSWVFGGPPSSVMAGGGIDFYKQHEWYDNVMAIYEYETPAGTARAFYQVLTTTSHGGFYETFMGEDGALVISEVPQRGNHVLREAHAQLWDPFVKTGLILPSVEEAPAAAKTRDIVVDVRVSAELGSWPLPVELNKPAHQPHLENFFDAIRYGVPLNCPGEIGYETAVSVLKVNDAVEARRTLSFSPEEFLA